MKKILLSLMLLCSITTQAQLLSLDFTGYNGLASSVPVGYTITWNDTTSTSRSYYTTACCIGANAPAYKFGIDSATIITPQFPAGNNVVEFYMKGNGTQAVDNVFDVYSSADGLNWNILASFDSISSAAQIVQLQLNPSDQYLLFIYLKNTAGFNIGFDDLKVLAGTVGIGSTKQSNINVFPNPSRGPLTIENFIPSNEPMRLEISNILGKQVRQMELSGVENRQTIQLSDLADGIYTVKIIQGQEETLRKLVIKK